jgi:hypothetical protein
MYTQHSHRVHDATTDHNHPRHGSGALLENTRIWSPIPKVHICHERAHGSRAELNPDNMPNPHGSTVAVPGAER